jgi:hypothetical protein
LSEVVEMVAAALYGDARDIIIDGESIKDRQARQLTLSEEMLKANSDKDWVVLADLLDYELLPCYKEWAALWPKIREEA